MTKFRSLDNVSISIINGAMTGNATALDELISIVWPHAYKFAYSQLGDREAAKDVAQDACISLASSIEKLKDPQAFRPWILQIVARRAYRYAKKARLGNVFRDFALARAAESEDFVDAFDALRRLAPRLRVVIALSVLEGLNSTEIGNILGIPSGTVRYRLSEARSKLDDLRLPTRLSKSSNFEVVV